MTTKLTVKERRFIDAYLGSCNGNATQAIIVSGYSTTRNVKSAGVMGTKVLAKGRVRAEVDRRLARATRSSILTADQRDAILSLIADSDADDHNRIAAIKELNKCSGRHSIKHVLDVTETLSDIIAGSRGK